jgi:hypothetical protein
MKTKALFACFVALFAVFLVSVVSAAPVAETGSVKIYFNDVEITDTTELAGMAGEVIPVRVIFTAGTDSVDVKVKAEIYSGRDSSVDSTSRFNIVADKTYTKLLSLQLPTDLKDVTKDLTLEVSIVDANSSTDNYYSTDDLEVAMQRESYEFDILSVDHNLVVSADEIMAVAVVVKNTGFERADDGFVVVSIPELGISAKGYLGDLVADEPVEEEEDSVQKVLYLRIPSNAKSGVYDVNVKAYNSDSATSVTGAVKVLGSNDESKPIAADKDAKEGVSTSVVIWTIVLVVIFLALLAILVALLMKKDKPIEEVETSYY